ncbi:MAG: hypothetical protein Kow00109_13250 [Acidobacteriota bacterium]
MDIREVEVPEVPGSLWVGRLPAGEQAAEEWNQVLGGFTVVVVLAGPEEGIGLPPSPEAEGKSAARLFWLATPNLSIPVDEQQLGEALRTAAEALQGGGKVLVACPTGIGRTGTFAVCLLVYLGLDKLEANIRLADAAAGPESGIQESLIEAVVRYMGTRV